MERLDCWAEVKDPEKRAIIMNWVKLEKFTGFREDGDRIYVTFYADPKDTISQGRKWAIIHFFESYIPHSINCYTL